MPRHLPRVRSGRARPSIDGTKKASRSTAIHRSERRADAGLTRPAALITVFRWNDTSPFGQATGSAEAKAAYRKVLSGEPLQE
jgi:hypothetical protein